MGHDIIRDCTACANLRTYPNPSQPFHHWQCAASGACVGPTVGNCMSFTKRTGGECPPKADVERFTWRNRIFSAPTQCDLFDALPGPMEQAA